MVYKQYTVVLLLTNHLLMLNTSRHNLCGQSSFSITPLDHHSSGGKQLQSLVDTVLSACHSLTQPGNLNFLIHTTALDKELGFLFFFCFFFFLCLTFLRWSCRTVPTTQTTSLLCVTLTAGWRVREAFFTSHCENQSAK